jgi:hypothetical protein
MQLTDPGGNKRYAFKYVSGAINVMIKRGLLAGANDLRVIINNTGTSIQSAIQPVSSDNPNSLGLAAYLTYR